MFAAPPTMNLTVLRSPDIDRAAEFYSRLGLVFLKHRHGSGPEHDASCVDGFVFECYPLGKHAPTIGTRIGFSVADVDSIASLLVEIGAEWVSPPADGEWEGRPSSRISADTWSNCSPRQTGIRLRRRTRHRPP